MITRDIEKAYNTIKGAKDKYGTYYKTLFHLHTPQSFDYHLRKNWKPEEYQKKTELDIFAECVKEGVLPESFELQKLELTNKKAMFKDKKEFLAYLLLAHCLLKNDIELVAVTDHNVLGGAEKLECALSELKSFRSYAAYTEVLHGIEISCADKLHVVALFENAEENRKKINEWLDGNLLPGNEGTYLTSYSVLQFFNDIGAVAYIAHLNSAAIFSEEKYLSGGYKKKLLESKYSQLLGVHDVNQIDVVTKRLAGYKSHEYQFVVDNDAHDIDSVNINFFWIKGSKRQFSMVREALSDFDVSVSYSESTKNKKYIAGIYVELGGFLQSKDKDDAFVLKFSSALNCFIGGRGTGKSTVLQMLDYCLSQNIDNERNLDFVCRHGNTYILYVDGEKEYMIEMLMPHKDREDNSVLKCFGQNLSNRYQYKYCFNAEEVKDYARKNHLSIYEIKQNEKTEFVKVGVKSKYLDGFFDSKYSVNDLVRTASGEEINDFIENMLFQNKTLSNPGSVIRARHMSGLVKVLNEMNLLLKKRKQEVESVVVPFNESQKDILKIVYTQNEIAEEPEFAQWFEFAGKKGEEWFNNYNIKKESIVSYLLNIYDNVGFVALMRMGLDRQEFNKRYDYSILSYAEEISFTTAELNLNKITEHNEKKVIDDIFKILVSENNLHFILEYLKIMVQQQEKISLQFNINSKTSGVGGTNFKDVMALSLGQKVVAMLDFVLGYGDYIGDYRPLLIDQPEDNLDSQYIYKNLVRQLREVKQKRQIIIATHNATIVANAMADQVCVMQSDGVNGWVEKAGYPSENKIKKSIVDYLEGGVESFRHKIQVYREIL